MQLSTKPRLQSTITFLLIASLIAEGLLFSFFAWIFFGLIGLVGGVTLFAMGAWICIGRGSTRQQAMIVAAGPILLISCAILFKEDIRRSIHKGLSEADQGIQDTLSPSGTGVEKTR